jgi:hypothetical protein
VCGCVEWMCDHACGRGQREELITMGRIRKFELLAAIASGALEAENSHTARVRERLARRVAEKAARKLEQQSEKQVGV